MFTRRFVSPSLVRTVIPKTPFVPRIQITKMSAQKEKKTYHKQATGAALETANAHAAEHPLKLMGSCFWSVPSILFSPPHYRRSPYSSPSRLTPRQPVRAARLDLPPA